jgi:hypothetical protein
MVVGHCQRHQLIELDFIRPTKPEQSRRDIGELEPLAHRRRGNAKSGRDFSRWPAHPKHAWSS